MTAEEELRAAFQRLKDKCPERVPYGTPVTQNNVAREAGKLPSGFKKTRYPLLIEEIQQYLANLPAPSSTSKRHAELKRRKKNRGLRELLNDVKKERDLALSLLVGADMKVLELYQRVADLEAQLPPSNVRSLGARR